MTKEQTEVTLRPLQARDIFPISRILSKIGLREFKGILESEDVRDAIAAQGKGEDSGIDLNAVGMTVAVEALDVIVSHLSDVEDDLYGILASLSGMKPKDIAAMPLIDFTNMIVDVITKPEFSDFAKVASRFKK